MVEPILESIDAISKAAHHALEKMNELNSTDTSDIEVMARYTLLQHIIHVKPKKTKKQPYFCIL